MLTVKVNTLTGPTCKLPDMTPSDLAARARTARLRAGFKKESDAAKAIGCSRPLVIRWESGAARTVGSKYLLSAARAYKVRPEWLALESDDDGYPWRPGVSGIRETAYQAAKPDADTLRTAMEITDRVFSRAGVTATAEARSRITLAVYELIHAGHGMDSAERAVTQMLSVIGGLKATIT